MTRSTYVVLTTAPKTHYVTKNGEIIGLPFRTKKAAQEVVDKGNNR